MTPDDVTPDEAADEPAAPEPSAPVAQSAEVLAARLAADERRIAELEARNAALAASGAGVAVATEPPRVKTHRFWVALLLVLGTILTPITILSLFLKSEIANTDRYVQTVKPLASDPAIQHYVAAEVSQELFDQVDIQQYVNDALPKRAEPLAGPLTSALKSFVEQAAMKVLETPQFQKLWIQANRIAHAQIVNALTGNTGGVVVTSRNGTVSLDLSTVSKLVETRLEESGIGLFKSVPIRGIGGKIKIFQSDDLYKARKAFGILDTAAFVLPFLVVACFGGAIYLSRRRRRAFVLAALGFALGAFLLGILLTVGRSIYLTQVTNTGVPYDAAAAIYDTLVRFLHTSVRAAGTFGLIVVLAVFFAGPSRLAVWFRSSVKWVANWLGLEAAKAGWSWLGPNDFVVRGKSVMRIIVTVLAFVILFFTKHPTPFDILLIVLLTLVVLAVIEFFGREPLAGGEAATPVAA